MSWVYRNGKVVERGGPEDIRQYVARSDLPRPMIISDALGGVVNPIDGKPYESKSAYYKTVKNAGCSILGNETIKRKDNDEIPAREIEADVAKAFQQLGS